MLAGQVLHVCPLGVGTWPPGQAEQELAPASEIVPAGQGVQELALAGEYDPAGQDWHPLLVEYCPAYVI